MRSRVQVSLPLQTLRKPLAASKWFFFYYLLLPSYTRCGRLAIRQFFPPPTCKIPAPNNLHRFHYKAPLREAILRCVESVQTGAIADCISKKRRRGGVGGRVYGGARQEREEGKKKTARNTGCRRSFTSRKVINRCRPAERPSERSGPRLQRSASPRRHNPS